MAFWSSQTLEGQIPLIFAIFNAGPSPVHLQRGLPLFLIWYAALDHPSEKRQTKPSPTTIPPALINNLTGAIDSLYALDKRVKVEAEKRREEDEKLSTRIHDFEKRQNGMLVTFGIVVTLLLGSLAVAFRSAVLSLLPASGRSASPPAITAPAPGALSPAGSVTPSPPPVAPPGSSDAPRP